MPATVYTDHTALQLIVEDGVPFTAICCNEGQLLTIPFWHFDFGGHNMSDKTMLGSMIISFMSEQCPLINI